MSTRTGWCMSADCDTDVRGGCPITAGSLDACDCPCHGGDTAARGYLEERLRISPAAAERMAREAAEDEGEEDPDPR